MNIIHADILDIIKDTIKGAEWPAEWELTRLENDPSTGRPRAKLDVPESDEWTTRVCGLFGGERSPFRVRMSGRYDGIQKWELTITIEGQLRNQYGRGVHALPDGFTETSLLATLELFDVYPERRLPRLQVETLLGILNPDEDEEQLHRVALYATEVLGEHPTVLDVIEKAEDWIAEEARKYVTTYEDTATYAREYVEENYSLEWWIEDHLDFESLGDEMIRDLTHAEDKAGRIVQWDH